jgi:hypothetical protein
MEKPWSAEKNYGEWPMSAAGLLQYSMKAAGTSLVFQALIGRQKVSMSLEHGTGDSFPWSIIAILAALFEGYWMDEGQLEETRHESFRKNCICSSYPRFKQRISGGDQTWASAVSDP